MSDLIKPVPEGTSLGDWTIKVNGEERTDVRYVKISNPKFGKLAWGVRPEISNSLGWMWEEVGGGGIGIVPYYIIRGELMIGVIEELRPAAGGKALNIPRGFLTPGESPLQAATSELGEEIGLIDRTLEPLGGEPVNSNTTFFETTPSADGPRGFRFYALRIMVSEVEGDEEGLRLRSDLFHPVNKMGEKIMKCVFLSWKRAMALADGFTCIGVGRLIAHMHEDLDITF